MTRDRLAVCSWSLRPDGPADLADALERLGLSAVQLALGPLLDQPDRWDDAGRVLAARGVRLASGMLAMPGEDYSTLASIARTGGIRPDAAWPANRARAEATAAIAAGLGLGLVTFHAGFLPEDRTDPERAVLLDRVREVAAAFADRGVNVALETGQETAATLLEALADLDVPTLGVNFDPANMILYGTGDPVDALRRLAPHVRQLHVKDAVPAAEPGTWGRETPAGDGAVDWPGVFEIVRALARPIDLVVEREAGPDREADVRRALRLVASALG